MTARAMPFRPLRSTFVVAGVVVAALLVTVVAAVALRDRPTPPSPARPFDEIAQDTSAVDQGIEIRALGASYSGTETLLRFRLTVDGDNPSLRDIAANDTIRRVVLSGYEGPFADGPMTSTVNHFGELLVHLPSLQSAIPGYDGSLTLSVTDLLVHFDSRTATLPGQWRLDLAGPEPTKLAEQLRVERLVSPGVELPAGSASVEAIRSRSTTEVTIVLPAETTMLTQPIITLRDGEQLAPVSFSVSEDTVTTAFVTTPFETPFVLQFGAIGAVEPGAIAPIVFSLASMPSGSGSQSEFDIPAGAVLSGPDDLVVRGERGDYDGREWAGLVLRGNWHPDNHQPVATDASGAALALAHVHVGYTKDVNGTVQEGTTAIAFFIDNHDLSRVTLTLGPRSMVDPTAYSTTLTPE